MIDVFRLVMEAKNQTSASNPEIRILPVVRILRRCGVNPFSNNIGWHYPNSVPFDCIS
jgi:hypothetical protein